MSDILDQREAEATKARTVVEIADPDAPQYHGRPFDTDTTRNESGAFSAELSDASRAAHKASARAHKTSEAADHQRAAKLHRVAAKRATEENQPAHAAMHEGIAKSHDAIADFAATSPVLANASLTAIDDDGWCLIAPFGEWPKTRVYREGGLVKEQKFIQVLDNESADAMVSKENSFFSKLKRAMVGIPVYKGHGDLNDIDPKALSNESQKIKLGVVDQIRKGAAGIEAHFALDNDGAEAVAAGWKFPSGFWYVLPNGTRGDAILARPFKLISVALTQFPNISGVESLANQRDTGPISKAASPAGSGAIPDGQNHQQKEPEMKLIAGWLIAQGIALANADAPTETQVLEAIQKLHTSKAADVTALGNEKTTLSGKITALENDVATQKKIATDATTALENERKVTKAERTAAATHATDLAIQQGKLTVAGRAAQITALENSQSFEADVKTLLEGKTIVKTATEAITGKQGAALSNEQAETREQYSQAFKTELIAAGQDPVRAHQNIMTLPKYSGLAAKLVPAAKFDARKQTL